MSNDNMKLFADINNHSIDKYDGSENAYIGAAHTPQYTITNDILFANVGPSESNTAPCLWIDTGSTRLLTYDSSFEVLGDGKVVGQQPVVCMKLGSWVPRIQEALGKSTLLESITTKRIANVNGVSTPLQETIYENCIVSLFRQRGDIIFFSFSYSKLTDRIIIIKSDGSEQGSVATLMDYEEGKFDASE